MTTPFDDYRRYVILLSHVYGKTLNEEIIRKHIAHLRELDQQGKLVLCGPFTDYKGGLVIIRAESLEEAHSIAASDPFVKEGYESFELRTLELSCEENNHLGMG